MTVPKRRKSSPPAKVVAMSDLRELSRDLLEAHDCVSSLESRLWALLRWIDQRHRDPADFRRQVVSIKQDAGALYCRLQFPVDQARRLARRRGGAPMDFQNPLEGDG